MTIIFLSLIPEQEQVFVLELLKTFGPITFSALLFIVVFYRILMKILSNQDYVNRSLIESSVRRDDEMRSLRQESNQNSKVIMEILDGLKTTINSLKTLENSTEDGLGKLVMEIQKTNTFVDSVSTELENSIQEIHRVFAELNQGINEILDYLSEIENKIVNKEEKEDESGTVG